VAKATATIRDGDKLKQVNIDSIPDLKVGDWILYINDLALKKISARDAKAVLTLLAEPRRQIKAADLSEKFRKIIAASKSRSLTRSEIVYLLQVEGSEKEALFSEANFVRRMYIKDFICVHGIIEFSNHCRYDCHYCGLRRANRTLPRYRLSADEIVDTACRAVKNDGYKLLVLQSGADDFYRDDDLAEIIKRIKAECRVFLFLSIGERSRAAYEKFKRAGVSGVLLRFETADRESFKRLHPQGKKMKNRFAQLKILRQLGYFVATGFITGLPGQSLGDLAADIMVTQKWAHMASVGPFVPSENTPLAKALPGDIEMNLKVVAILRLLMKSVRIPVTTALETLAGETGRKRALSGGANALMFNLTPGEYRPFYRIYPDKFFQRNTIWQKYGLFKYEESYRMLEKRMLKEIVKEKYASARRRRQ